MMSWERQKIVWWFISISSLHFLNGFFKQISEPQNTRSQPRGEYEAVPSDRTAVIPQKEVAMRIGFRCAECDSENPNIVSLQDPVGEHYCGRACFLKGRENYIRWKLGMRPQADAELETSDRGL